MSLTSARAALTARAFRLARFPPPHGRAVLPDRSELPFAGEVAMLLKALLTLGSLMLALRNNAAVFVHYQIILLKPGGPVSFVRSSMPHLGPRSSQQREFLPIDMEIYG